jgi:hypothetical protein
VNGAGKGSERAVSRQASAARGNTILSNTSFMSFLSEIRYRGIRVVPRLAAYLHPAIFVKCLFIKYVVKKYT